MTLLWDLDPASSERFNYAVGGDIAAHDSHVALMRNLGGLAAREPRDRRARRRDAECVRPV